MTVLIGPIEVLVCILYALWLLAAKELLVDHRLLTPYPKHLAGPTCHCNLTYLTLVLIIVFAYYVLNGMHIDLAIT